jgi:hypothetical protein
MKRFPLQNLVIKRSLAFFSKVIVTVIVIEITITIVIEITITIVIEITITIIIVVVQFS